MLRLTMIVLFVVFCTELLVCTDARRRSRNGRSPAPPMTSVVRLWKEVVHETHNIFVEPTPVPLDDCQESQSRSYQRSLEDPKDRLRSLSPFDYCINRNSSRYPPEVVQARCLVESCFLYNGSETPAQLMYSEKIYVHVRVIQFEPGTDTVDDCTNTTCHLRTIPVPVGCHCVIKEQ